jgi:hypothetical protein
MAGATLCVACAQLPTKDRSLAVKTQQCPECKATCGVTSYGAAFRVPALKRSLCLSPLFLTGATVGGGLFTFLLGLVGLGMWSHDTMVPPRPAVGSKVPHEFARVPEVAVDDPIPHTRSPQQAKQHIAQFVNRIKEENKVKQDNFLIAQMQQRKELRGMPFVMGGACRMDGGRATSFQSAVEAARRGMDQDVARSGFSHENESAPFWTAYLSQTGNGGANTPAGIAALTQILGPERGALRTSMVDRLSASDQADATRTIAKAAVFDASLEVRLAATKALKKRPAAEYTDILMHGMRYPLATVTNQAAAAIIALDRKDLVPQLVNFLGEPAPGDPEAVEDKTCVREVVRINHHRNCLLCHPPAGTGQPNEVPGVIPIPGESFPASPSQAYGSAQFSGDPMVRADTTYLRQDFSVRMPVENADPWPQMQRFDFLVRTRVVEGKELAALQQRVAERPAGFRSENHKAAARALQELTGHDNVPATKEAWQRVLAANGQ